jgi:hypothetical protein
MKKFEAEFLQAATLRWFLQSMALWPPGERLCQGGRFSTLIWIKIDLFSKSGWKEVW